MNYSEKTIDELIRDYRDEFCVHLSYEDAIRMMLLVDMLGEVFEKYETEEDVLSFVSPMLGL
jgi:hypothetical protein